MESNGDPINIYKIISNVNELKNIVGNSITQFKGDISNGESG